jgi:hypothetical protein
MKALSTRVGTYVTGDAVADAVLGYALALARVQSLDLVEIPFRAANGAVSRVQLRLGWLVDLDCVSHGGLPESELIDGNLIADLSARVLALHPNGGGSFGTGEMPSVIGGLDEY